ncbi:hypothetical protein M8J77_018236 [Diaphorina citri]|nr:hypothetical protein M8J77_018236 [Diaphorina citri]
MKVRKTCRIGRSHNQEFVLFRLGSEASPGVRSFAESGKADSLPEDGQGHYGLFDIFSAPAIQAGAGRTESQFFVDGNHSRPILFLLCILTR